MADEQELGPVDYLVIEFGEGNFTGEGVGELLRLVDAGIIRIYDAVVIKAGEDGTYAPVTVDDIGNAEIFAAFQGVRSDMLNQFDFDAVGSILTPGSLAAIVVYENTWAARFATVVRNHGGTLAAFGRIPVEALLETLQIETPTA